MDILHEQNLLSTVIRLVLALLCGALLGIERGRKHRPAGFRTYMLVCMGSTLVMITNQYISSIYPLADPARLGAQVISGIGFLGAGTIIVTGRNKVRGLTTAAGLWAVACVGLAIGIGFYSGALIGCVLTFFTMAVLHHIDENLMSSTKVMDIYIELNSMNQLGGLMDYAKENQLKLSELEINRNVGGVRETVGVMVTVQTLTKRSHAEILGVLSKAEGIVYIEEV